MRNVLVSRRNPVFIECGVGMGLTLFTFLEWLDVCPERDLDSSLLTATFLEFDTFQGIDLDLVSEDEIDHAKFSAVPYGDTTLEVAKERFKRYPQVRFIPGSVPSSLTEIDAVPDFLHIDMNNPVPEVETLLHFWPKLMPGAIVLFDDYGFVNSVANKQRAALNEALATQDSCLIAGLPTGQGILIK